MKKQGYEEPNMEWIPFAGDVITASDEREVIDVPGGGGWDIDDDSDF